MDSGSDHTTWARAFLAVVLALLAMPVLAAPPSSADTPTSGGGVVLVVDRSGSMRENDGTGRIKLEGARSAVNAFARSLPTDMPLAVRTYPSAGPTDDDGCSPGVVQVPANGGLAPVDVTAVTSTVRSLTADGETPTSAALLAAADDLQAGGFTNGTIVLVSDGVSTCGEPPCEGTAQAIMDRGLDVTVHAVGFQIDNEGREELACLADAMGGRYVGVANSAELVTELGGLRDADLGLSVDHPTRVDLIAGTDGGGDITVAATVDNLGAASAADVQVSLEFPLVGERASELAPAVLNRRRRLGNLGPGEAATATWTFRPILEFIDRELTFDVVATSADGARVVAEGTIRLDAELSMDMAGPVLQDRRVAIMGDSYSSGEGAGNYLEGTDTDANACHRSPDTYLAPLLQAPTIIACSGAIISDLYADNHVNVDEPSQLAQLVPASTDAVALTLGGNDVGFASVIAECVLAPRCQGDAEQRDQVIREVCGGRPLAAAVIVPEQVTCHAVASPTLEERTMSTIRGLFPRLRDAYRAIDDRVNRSDAVAARDGRIAPVLVLAYVNTMPANAISRGNCSPLLSAGEMAFIQRATAALNGVIAEAVAAVAAEGRPVHFVPDTEAAFQPDHTYCDADARFVNDLDVSDTVVAKAPLGMVSITPVGQRPVAPSGVDRRRFMEQLHPTAAGYRAITAAVLRWSTSAAAPREITRDDLPDTLAVAEAQPSATIHIGPNGAAEPPQLQGGQVIQLQGSGLVPETPGQLTIESDRQILAMVRADTNGRVAAVVRLPDLPPGTHHLGLLGVTADGPREQLSVVVVVPSQPLWARMLGWASGILLLAATSTAWVLRPRRS